MRSALPCALALAITTACHTQQSGAPSGSRNVITRDQIEATGAANTYDLIARLHAEYLKDRGRVSINLNAHERAVVFLNDQEYGALETMRNIPTSRVGEIRYYAPTEAIARFGAQYGGGVIQLISRTE